MCNEHHVENKVQDCPTAKTFEEPENGIASCPVECLLLTFSTMLNVSLPSYRVVIVGLLLSQYSAKEMYNQVFCFFLNLKSKMYHLHSGILIGIYVFCKTKTGCMKSSVLTY